MEGNSSQYNWKQQPGSNQVKEEEEEEEEAEALSLCDLPVNLIREDGNQLPAKEEDDEEGEGGGGQQSQLAESTHQEEFDFGRWRSGSLSVRSEMCAAEDIFYKGQILPLRHSVSSTSDRGLISYRIRRDNLYPVVNINHSCSPPLNLNQSTSSSDSVDRGLLSGLNSFSSSSSSKSTTQSSSSSAITTGSEIPTGRINNSKPKAINQFHICHPSPKPPIIRHSSVPSAASMGSSSTFSRNRKSSVWDFFRLGLVRTPGIHELQELKVRSSVSRNSSSGSSSFSTGISLVSSSKIHSGGTKVSEKEVGKKKKKQAFFEKRGGSLLSGCSCKISAVKPVPLNNVIIKRGDDINGKSAREGVVEKQQELKMIKQKNKKKKRKKKKTVEKLKEKEVGKEDHHQEGIGKQELSRHRTFEWIKELSHANYIDDEREVVVASLD